MRMGRDDDGQTVEQLIDALIEREGGYVHLAADRGGPTCFGISEAVARAHGYSGAMRELPREEAVAIYRRLYWLRPGFDQLAKRSPRLAAELFDTGANMGPAVAATFLQRALTALNRNGRDYGNYILDKAGRGTRVSEWKTFSPPASSTPWQPASTWKRCAGRTVPNALIAGLSTRLP
jgi:hypothetical protein